MTRIIIEDRDDWVLQVRAARSALKDGIAEGAVYGIRFEDGSSYGVKRNKDSIRVYPQDDLPEPPASLMDGGEML